MRSLVLLALIGAVVWALTRSLREQRQARLGLVGAWKASSDGGAHELTLSGGPGGGEFVEITRIAGRRQRESGRWRTSGGDLLFTDHRGHVTRCELRLFDAGRIGVHGPGRERRVYERHEAP